MKRKSYLIATMAFLVSLGGAISVQAQDKPQDKPLDKGSKPKQTKTAKPKPAPKKAEELERVVKSEAEWKKLLTPMQFDVTRKAGTERAFTGEYWNNHDVGLYKCVDCGQELFTSKTKFESGTGWPSFYQAISDKKIKVLRDPDGERSEVLCARCDAHLGHVFNDGPKPTGLRYCMNSVSMKFFKDVKKK